MNNPYDRLAYLNQPITQSHPDRLALLARLHGMEPPPVERARVLDLGASEGGNIIPMAMTLPGAEFTGIDLATVPVERGRRIIADLRLQNVRLLQMDLLQVDSSFGTFDYIIAHGLYAWTPPAVRDKILAIARENLSPHGVAFVSYNAYPGGHLRRLFRDVMLYHAGQFEDPEEKVAQARAMLQLLAAGRPEPDAFDRAVAAEAAELLNRDDSMIYHDYLADIFEPSSLRDFVAHAATHGLQYLDDASIFDTSNPKVSEEAKIASHALAGGDRVAEEQYLDLFRLRRFRQSLVCHSELSLVPHFEAQRVAGLYASSPAEETAEGVFLGRSGLRMTTTHPKAIEYLRRLIAIWPGAEEVKAGEAGLALQLLRAGVVELNVLPSAGVRAGDKPIASPFARYQAERKEARITTLRHRSLAVEGDREWRLLQLLDGTRDRDTLALEMPCSRQELDAQLDALGRYAILLA
jgi:hypothetical protein